MRTYSITGSGERIAYVIEQGVGNRRGLCRAWCLPNALLLLLILLFAAATAQVALFHYYGTSDSGAFNPSTGHLILSPIAMTRSGIRPLPAKINLRDLVSRNVPSIAASRRQLFVDIATDHVNQLLLNQQSAPDKTHWQSEASRTPDWNSESDEHVVLNRRSLPLCPKQPPALEGRLSLNMSELHDRNYTNIDDVIDLELRAGGAFRPAECHARHRVGLIVPYRDRLSHLLMLLHHLHPILQRQQLDYRVFVVEQFGNLTFNKARIMNIAFVTALHEDPTIECFIFHDVDLMPEDDRNMYSCPPLPRHMSAAIDEMNYQVPYEQLVGGVFAIRTEQFFKVNGYSNLYWGWGAEDDDMAYRIQHVGLRITRPPQSIARYKMMRHTKRPAVDGRIRYRLLWTGVRRYRIDGLNSLSTLKYKILSVKNLSLYTHILVDVGPPPPGF